MLKKNKILKIPMVLLLLLSMVGCSSSKQPIDGVYASHEDEDLMFEFRDTYMIVLDSSEVDEIYLYKATDVEIQLAPISNISELNLEKQSEIQNDISKNNGQLSKKIKITEEDIQDEVQYHSFPYWYEDDNTLIIDTQSQGQGILKLIKAGSIDYKGEKNKEIQEDVAVQEQENIQKAKDIENVEKSDDLKNQSNDSINEMKDKYFDGELEPVIQGLTLGKSTTEDVKEILGEPEDIIEYQERNASNGFSPIVYKYPFGELRFVPGGILSYIVIETDDLSGPRNTHVGDSIYDVKSMFPSNTDFRAVPDMNYPLYYSDGKPANHEIHDNEYYGIAHYDNDVNIDRLEYVSGNIFIHPSDATEDDPITHFLTYETKEGIVNRITINIPTVW